MLAAKYPPDLHLIMCCMVMARVTSGIEALPEIAERLRWASTAPVQVTQVGELLENRLWDLTAPMGGVDIIRREHLEMLPLATIAAQVMHNRGNSTHHPEVGTILLQETSELLEPIKRSL